MRVMLKSPHVVRQALQMGRDPAAFGVEPGLLRADHKPVLVCSATLVAK